MTDWKPILRSSLPPLSVDPAREAEIVDELAQHLTDTEAAAVAAGATACEAADAARAELPDAQQMARDIAQADRMRPALPPAPPAPRWWSPRGTLHEFRYAFRQLRRAPGYATAVMAILAVALGANTAVFSVVNGVLLEPLTYPEPERLVRVYEGPHTATDPSYVMGPTLTLIRDHARSFESVAGLYTYRPTGADLTGAAAPRRLTTLSVTGDYFRVLGIRPAYGRAFDRSEERPDAGVVVVSFRLASEVCGEARRCLGRTLTVDGAGARVIGIMPVRFRDPISDQADVWTPHVIKTARGDSYVSVLARLRPGSTVESARAEVAGLVAADAADHHERQPTSHVFPLQADVVARSRVLLSVLLGAVSFVLLVACLNIANLVLARGVSRERELAIRAALGAGRLRLLRQLMAESLLLSAGGGIAGIAVALLVTPALLALDPAAIPRVDEIVPDWRVAAFAIALTMATSLAFGLPTWLQLLRRDPERLLQGSGKGSRRGPEHRWFRRGLVVAQVALAVALLSASAVLVTSFSRLATTDLGFTPARVLTYRLDLPTARYPTGASRAALHRRLMERVESIPGVASAGMTSKLPATGHLNRWGVEIVGRPADAADGPDAIAEARCVDGHYFESLGIRLVRGRLLGAEDRTESAPAVVVSETMARSYWPKGDALGASVRVADDAVRTVVGIVRDVRPSFDESPVGMLYVPHTQIADERNWSFTHVVRVAPGAGDLAAAVRREVRGIDADLVVHHEASLEEVVGRNIAGPRFATLLMSGFGLMALLLAAAGIFCVLAYSVSERTVEIGVRVALGASRSAIAWMVTRGAGACALVGVAAGLAGAVAARRLLASLVPGVGALEPLTLAGVATVLFVVAIAACYLPARWAAQVDPVRALRAD